MTEKEAQKVLDELNTVRIEVLNDKAKRLFEAIMLIADERDKYKNEVIEKDNRIKQLENMNEFQSKDIKKTVDYTFELNKEIELKDKIIDLMAERVLLTEEEWKEIKEKNIYNVIKKDTHKLIKQYFENKAKEILNK